MLAPHTRGQPLLLRPRERPSSIAPKRIGRTADSLLPWSRPEQARSPRPRSPLPCFYRPAPRSTTRSRGPPRRWRRSPPPLPHHPRLSPRQRSPPRSQHRTRQRRRQRRRPRRRRARPLRPRPRARLRRAPRAHRPPLLAHQPPQARPPRAQLLRAHRLPTRRRRLRRPCQFSSRRLGQRTRLREWANRRRRPSR